jgi:hypothetical protein
LIVGGAAALSSWVAGAEVVDKVLPEGLATQLAQSGWWWGPVLWISAWGLSFRRRWTAVKAAGALCAGCVAVWIFAGATAAEPVRNPLAWALVAGILALVGGVLVRGRGDAH